MLNHYVVHLKPGFPGGSDGKESVCNAGFDPWVGKIPWRRERLPNPVKLVLSISYTSIFKNCHSKFPVTLTTAIRSSKSSFLQECMEETSWWSSGSDSKLPLQGPWVWALVEELKSWVRGWGSRLGQRPALQSPEKATKERTGHT